MQRVKNRIDSVCCAPIPSLLLPGEALQTLLLPPPKEAQCIHFPACLEARGGKWLDFGQQDEDESEVYCSEVDSSSFSCLAYTYALVPGVGTGCSDPFRIENHHRDGGARR